MSFSAPADSDDLRLVGLSRFLISQPGVEAVRIDPENRRLSVATLGNVDVAALQEALRQSLAEVEALLPEQRTGLSPSIRVDKEGDGTVLRKPTCPTAPTFWKWRELDWFEEEEEEEDWRELATYAGICGALLVSGFLVHKLQLGPSWLDVVFYAGALLAGGRDAAEDAWHNLRRGRLDIHFLMLAVAAGASLVGAWGEGALLLFLFSASGAMEAYASHRTRGAIDSLLKATPRHAIRLRSDGSEEEVPAESLQPGDILVVRPGDLFAVDSLLTDGQTAADESALTGESLPVAKNPGDEVFGGTLNTWGSVKARVLRPLRQSALQKIIDLIRNAQNRRAPAQRFTDRFGTGYTWVVLGCTALMFFVWWIVLKVPPFENNDGYSAFYRAMTLMVVMSPCALVLSIPSAILAAIAAGARQGFLFRGGAAVEELARVDCVALDKTGTLTSGELEVEQVLSLPPGRERDVAELAYSMEVQASHPIARAIVRYGRKQGLSDLGVGDFQNHTGQGVSARLNGELCVIGRRELVAQGAVAALVDAVPLPEAACSEIWILKGDVLGRMLLRDRVRVESKPVLESLHELGLRTVMLTGDRQQVADQVGAEIGLDAKDIRGGLLPADKVRAIEELTREGHVVAMVGDGINDAPSLAAAQVAVGMGARGSDAAVEQSDVVLMNDRIDLFLKAYLLSRRARTIIRQNLVVAFGTVVVMALGSLTGKIPLSLGVMAHEGSTVLVCLNSLRLLFRR
ncbi:MAG: heavy metal translocating P-type ATPase [Candidatus Methylacidiphilales bacterium]|nr:heavy metal translocating P-type ATPase [Candidatus Methylacidiphilales bacterium]